MKNRYLLNPCETRKQTSDAYKLRYIAYRNVGAIEANDESEFTDKYDVLPNSKTCVIHNEEGNVIASIRACIYIKEHNFMHLPSFEVYKEEIEKEIGLDKVIVESNRFVIDPSEVDSKDLFKFAFKFITLNVLKFNSDYFLAAVRPKHIPLYQRYLGMKPISAPKKYSGVNIEMIIMAGECKSSLQMLTEREDFFRFTEEDVDNYAFEAAAYMELESSLAY